MVGPWQPQRRLALQPVVANQYVLNRHEHRMTHMKRVVSVWRRHNNTKRLVPLRLKTLSIFPLLVNLFFLRDVVIFFHLRLILPPV